VYRSTSTWEISLTSSGLPGGMRTESQNEITLKEEKGAEAAGEGSHSRSRGRAPEPDRPEEWSYPGRKHRIFTDERSRPPWEEERGDPFGSREGEVHSYLYLEESTRGMGNVY